MRAARLVLAAAAVLGAAVPGTGAHAWADKEAQRPSAGRTVDFDRDIQPIFGRHCIRCHGATDRAGGLGLGGREAAFGLRRAQSSRELDSSLEAIVPGAPDESELLRRVASEDPAERMPRDADPLQPQQVELLRQWIAEGADWPPYWAYRPLGRRGPPDRAGLAHGDWARSPVDLYILERLQQLGLRPSPPADRRTWLRRVSLSLTGLPPTPDEMAAFLADQSPDAFERKVDRLLASPHYGERWARHWMDVVHYAETHGHDQDRPRPSAWPYRDYLIRSFNADKPYGRFVEEQLAGDVLDPNSPEAIIATGFLATGPWDESSLRDIREDTIDREIARYLDRDDIVTTVLSTFASSTVHCARCHDHKFDPIKQQDYYALQAVFAGIDKAERHYDLDPQLAGRRRELARQVAELPELRARRDARLLDPELRAKIASWEQQLAAESLSWTVLDPRSFEAANGSTLSKQPDLSLLAGGERPETDTYTVVAETGLPRITALRLEVLTDDSLPHKGPGRQDNGNLHLNEISVTAAPTDAPDDARPLVISNPRADFDQEGWTIAMALDGNPQTAWGIFPEVGKPHRAVFELCDPLALDSGVVLSFRLEQSHGGGHLIGRVRLSATDSSSPSLEADTLPVDIADILRIEAAGRTEQQQADLAAHYLEQQLKRELAALPPPEKVYAGTNQFEPDGSFRPTSGPRVVHVLQRGDIRQPLDPASPGTLSCLPNLDGRFELADPGDEGSRRAALARWLSDPANVLTWRSIVNRVWHYHFGRGLVDTPNDFGRMGSSPTHPELLDFLARYLLAHGGSLKQLHKLIVTSAVYRQSSAHDAEMARVDADNRYLWRMNRSRLDAESVRDCILLVSGKLDRTMGGPSVKQFIESPGVHVTPKVDYQNFDVDDPGNYRRSVYRFIFRTLPDPFMDSLDCADASQLTPARNASVTALQALAMLNNKFVVRESEHLAERLARVQPDLPGQVALLYRWALGRDATDREREAFVAYAERHGLANACRILLNSNEFMFVN